MVKAEPSQFIKSTFFTGFGKVSAILLGLASLMIITRVVPPEELGAFMLLQVIVVFLEKISSFGLDLSIPKFMASTEDEGDERSLVNTVLHFRALTVVLASIVALGGQRMLFALFGSFQYSRLIIFVPILLTLASARKLFDAVLEGSFRFRSIGIVSVISSCLSLISRLVLVVWFEQGLLGLLYSDVISKTIACVIAYFAAQVDYRLEFDFVTLRRMLAFGLPIHLNSIMTFVFTRIDTVLVGALIGPAQLAFYEIARRFPDTFEELYGAFRQVYFPFVSRLFAQGDKRQTAAVINHSARLISFFGTLGALAAFLFGTEIVVLMFSERYLSSAAVLPWLMVGLTFSLVDYTLGYSLTAIGESDKPPIKNVVRTGVSFGSYLLLMPALGTVGAALGGLVGALVANPLNVFFLRRRGVGAKLGDSLRPLLILGILLVPLHLSGPTGYLQKILFVVLFILGSLLLSVIKIEDITIISREVKTMVHGLVRRAAL